MALEQIKTGFYQEFQLFLQQNTWFVREKNNVTFLANIK